MSHTSSFSKKKTHLGMIVGLCCLPTASVKASSPSRTLLALDDQAKFPDPKGNYVQLHVAIVAIHGSWVVPKLSRKAERLMMGFINPGQNLEAKRQRANVSRVDGVQLS